MDRAEKRRRAWESIHGRPPTKPKDPRPYLGIRFDCCGVYSRVYKNEEERVYEGRCPKCLARVRIRIGSEGTSERFFRAW